MSGPCGYRTEVPMFLLAPRGRTELLDAIRIPYHTVPSILKLAKACPILLVLQIFLSSPAATSQRELTAFTGLMWSGQAS